jgi:histidinol-phosphate aminotransferase
MFNLDNILRENIKKLVPYSSARDEYQDTGLPGIKRASVFLDANENSFGSPLTTPYNRYPDPLQKKLKQKISEIKGVPENNIFLGNGSDEAIDILFRAFCRPGIDNVIITPPTYGMYEVSADINDAELRKAPLTPDFHLTPEKIAEKIDESTKLIFICSPNNPTGNSMDPAAIKTILASFNGIVVIDEAYINYSEQKSFIYELKDYANLVVLQTLSKAWGLAALRIGMAFASKEIIQVFNKIKPPYNINHASQQLALQALDNKSQIDTWVKQIISERDQLVSALKQFNFVIHIYPSDANFILVKTKDPRKIYSYLVGEGIIVRDRSNVELCEGCLRITVGTPQENQDLLNSLRNFV